MYSIKAECEGCGKEVVVNGNTLRDKYIVLKETNKPVRIMYYLCKACGYLHVVQLDTKQTLKDLERLKKMTIKYRRGKLKTTDGIDKLKNDLAFSRSELIKECNGMHYVNELGKEVELVVSVITKADSELS